MASEEFPRGESQHSISRFKLCLASHFIQIRIWMDYLGFCLFFFLTNIIKSCSDVSTAVMLTHFFSKFLKLRVPCCHFFFLYFHDIKFLTQQHFAVLFLYSITQGLNVGNWERLSRHAKWNFVSFSSQTENISQRFYLYIYFNIWNLWLR